MSIEGYNGARFAVWWIWDSWRIGRVCKLCCNVQSRLQCYLRNVGLANHSSFMSCRTAFISRLQQNSRATYFAKPLAAEQALKSRPPSLDWGTEKAWDDNRATQVLGLRRNEPKWRLRIGWIYPVTMKKRLFFRLRNCESALVYERGVISYYFESNTTWWRAKTDVASPGVGGWYSHIWARRGICRSTGYGFCLSESGIGSTNQRFWLEQGIHFCPFRHGRR